jgi:hypothetical protein
MVSAQHAPLHDFGKNKFTAKESNITIVFDCKYHIYIFRLMALLGDRHRAGGQPYNPDLNLVHIIQLYPKHIIKLGQPKPARSPIEWCAQLRAPHGRHAQSGAPACATRTAVSDNQYILESFENVFYSRES